MRRLLLTICIALAFCVTAHAQTKISALPSGTPVTTDIVPFVADPAGTAATKKTTVSDLFGALTPIQLQSGNKHGDGTKFQLFTGSSSANDCAKFDSNGNVVSAGGTCASLSPVQSVFGRTGAVVAATNDYNFNQLAGTASNSQLPSTLSSKTFDNTNTANFKGSLFTLQDATDTTKQARFDLSNISTATTRTVNIPDAASTTAQAKSATSHQFLTAMSSQGVFSAAQPDAADMTGLAPSATTDTTNASNITSGTLPNARLSAVPNSALANSSVTLNSGSNFGMTLPGAATLGSTYTVGSTSDNLRFANLGLGQAAPTGGGQIASTLGANNLDGLTITRNTDTSPTGNFVNFKNAAGSSVWKVDITGSLAAGTVPVARVSGLATSATTDTTDASNISSGTLDKNRVPGTLNATAAPSLAVTGTAGAGFVELPEQSSAPSTPTNAIRIYADSSNRFSWKGENGFTRTFDGTSNTTDRTYVLPDRSATVATTSGTLTSGNCAKFDASGNLVDFGAACASAGFMPVYARVTGSNATTTSTSLVDVTGLSVALAANSVYEFVANITGNGADANGVKFGVNYSAAGATVEAGIYADVAGTGTRTRRINALNSATAQAFFTSSNDVAALIQGTITTGVNAGNVTIQHLKVTSGTSTIYIGSYLKVTKIQ
jgi:hypothetical protein